MNVLIIKLTSMGDTLHLLPALSDLYKHHPNVKVDWMVEESFAEIPTWHPAVRRTITVATRRWRSLRWRNLVEFYRFVRALRSHKYDVVVDAQGLMKSAVLARFARLNRAGRRTGFCAESCKEPLAAKLYSQKISVERNQHAIVRLRQLLATTFGYRAPSSKVGDVQAKLDYQIKLPGKRRITDKGRTIFFLHGTTWPSKHMADQVWRELVELVTDDGYQIKLCWGDEVEQQRANWIAQASDRVQVLPKLGLTEIARQIQNADGVISVDTGLGHLAAALGIPNVSIYGATDAKLTGARGENQIHLQMRYSCSPCLLKNCAKLTQQILQPPCYASVPASHIWQVLYEQIA